MKETWKILNNVLGRNKQTKIALFFFKDSDGNKIIDLNKIANNFNDFLNTNIGTKLANKISHPILTMFPHLNLKTNKIAFFLNPTNTGEIVKITKSLKASNSSEIGNFSTKLLKTIINEIASVVSHIFNRSLLSGIVPSQLKLLKSIQYLNRVIIKC